MARHRSISRSGRAHSLLCLLVNPDLKFLITSGASQELMDMPYAVQDPGKLNLKLRTVTMQRSLRHADIMQDEAWQT
jgi:hypothetical protein